MAKTPITAGLVVQIRVPPRDVQACIALFEAYGARTPGISIASVIRRSLSGLIDTAIRSGITPEPDPFQYSNQLAPYKPDQARQTVRIKSTFQEFHVRNAAEINDQPDPTLPGIPVSIEQNEADIRRELEAGVTRFMENASFEASLVNAPLTINTNDPAVKAGIMLSAKRRAVRSNLDSIEARITSDNVQPGDASAVAAILNDPTFNEWKDEGIEKRAQDASAKLAALLK